MRKIFLIFFIIIILFTSSSCSKSEYIRLRIIANSNELQDIEDKTIIKTTIKKLFNSGELNYHTLNVENLNSQLSQSLSCDFRSFICLSQTIVCHFQIFNFSTRYISAVHTT